ncbi:hypothetical protein CRG98_000636 [Punica granatum]|uniref:Uncharacterized protein n=1 Tax=Punica granatum TaxID=22663 RepID=A0A2I0LE86_PUNGR|nr:hypothetical protein CRG98_000636 [Punica granatum]
MAAFAYPCLGKERAGHRRRVMHGSRLSENSFRASFLILRWKGARREVTPYEAEDEGSIANNVASTQRSPSKVNNAPGQIRFSPQQRPTNGHQVMTSPRGHTRPSALTVRTSRRHPLRERQDAVGYRGRAKHLPPARVAYTGTSSSITIAKATVVPRLRHAPARTTANSDPLSNRIRRCPVLELESRNTRCRSPVNQNRPQGKADHQRSNLIFHHKAMASEKFTSNHPATRLDSDKSTSNRPSGRASLWQSSIT